MKQTAVEWLVEQLKDMEYDLRLIPNTINQAKAMEKEQSGYSDEDVIKIVEKSRETGLTAEYLLLTFKKQEQ
jgi:hypothetical protein